MKNQDTITKDEQIQSIIEKHDLEKTDTTTGMNGYPEWTDVAFYHGKRSVLEQAISEIGDIDGVEVTELMMKRRDGQHFWNRYYSPHVLCDLKATNEQDFWVVVDSNGYEEDQKEQIFRDMFADLFEEHEEVNYDLISKVKEQVDSLYLDIPQDEGEVYAFWDGVNGHNGHFDYCISDESTGYHDGDVTAHQMAFSVNIDDEDE